VIRHKIFTGCARPALFLGVPMIVLILSGLATLLLAGSLSIFISGWAALPVVVAFFIFYFWARAITRLDEWRLFQVIQRTKLRNSSKASKKLGGVLYTPVELKVRKHDPH
jgi:type IV secretory pathway VirB3-like protein